MIDAILEDLKRTNELPGFIGQIVGEVPQEQDGDRSILSSSIDVDIYRMRIHKLHLLYMLWKMMK